MHNFCLFFHNIFIVSSNHSDDLIREVNDEKKGEKSYLSIDGNLEIEEFIILKIELT